MLREYYHTQLQENIHDSKKIFRVCDGILGWKWDLPLPPGHTDEELAEWINNFFIAKIVNIRNNLKAIHPWAIIAEDNKFHTI